MQRRHFLKTAAATALSASTMRSLWALPADHPYIKTIGLQLWTVRNQLDQDVPKTLKAVAAAGYKQVELMRTLDSDDLVSVAKDQGLDVTSAFIDWQIIGSEGKANVPSFDAVVEAAKKIGLRYVVFGYIGKGSRETTDQLKVLAERCNRAGEKCRAAGMQLCYHNHSFEFQKLDGNKTGFDVFIDHFDKDLVKFELDVFWVAIGGWDVLQTMRRLNGRIAQLHLKDLLRGTQVCHDESQVPHEAFKELGNGVIDMADVIRVGLEVGGDQCHVEQDQSPDPIASIGQSLQHLRKL